MRQRARSTAAVESPTAERSRGAPATPPRPAEPKAEPKRLSYKLQRELELLPAEIERLETDLRAIHAQMADPAFYQSPTAALAAVSAQAADLQTQLETAFARWEELESLRE